MNLIFDIYLLFVYCYLVLGYDYMNSHTKLEQQIAEYAALAKDNKKIDVASLMLNALQSENRNTVNQKAKRWAYFIAIAAPPFGLLLALKYYFSDKDDAKYVANVCVVLTIVSLGLLWFFAHILLSSGNLTPAQLEQIQHIKPSDIQELTQ